MSSLLICFNADGPYAENAVLVAGYPSGFSYFRPFRYREQWVEPEILRQDETTMDQVLLAMRFRSPGLAQMILPIRKVRIISKRITGGDVYVDFQMLSMVDFRACEDLRTLLIRKPTADNQLLFKQNDPLPTVGFCPNLNEELVSWIKYTKLIAASDLPFPDRIKQALFLRLNIPDTNSEIIQKLSSRGAQDVYGIHLKEGSSQILQIYHQVPHLIGSEQALTPVSVEYRSSHPSVRFERTDEEYSGKYQDHLLQIDVGHSTKALIDVRIKPEYGSTEKNVTLYPLQFNCQVGFSFRHRFIKRWWWTLLLFLALLSVSFSEVFAKHLETNVSIPLRVLGPAIVSLLLASPRRE
jgi:hypothetical protein